VLLGTDVLLVSGGGGSSNNPGAGGCARGSPGQANTDSNFVWDGQGGTQTNPGAGGEGVTASCGGPGVDHPPQCEDNPPP